MANIEATDNWGADVYQWADGDVLDGGPESLEVLPVKQLANRSIYQRLRNVTPWSDTMAAAFGYPAGACVLHLGLSWRAKVANTVAPGSDATKWERWGYSQSELAAYLRGYLLSPVACPVTGPAAPPSDASPYTLWKSVAPYGEYWGWLGDAWMVVANHYTTYVGVASTARVAGVTSIICSIVVPRSGRVCARGILSQLNQINAYTYMSCYIKLYRGGAPVSILLNSLAKDVTTVGTEYSQARPYSIAEVLAGDTLALEASASQNMYASPSSNSSIHVEYLQ
jgi:hypothetical protein